MNLQEFLTFVVYFAITLADLSLSPLYKTLVGNDLQDLYFKVVRLFGDLQMLSCFDFPAVYSDEILSDKRFCGFQHTDDYVRADNKTSIDEFPWLAALIYKFEDETRAVLCSGVLINRRYVLTAAQCVTHPETTVLVGVRLGEFSLRNSTDCVTPLVSQIEECTRVSDYDIEEKLVHKLYNRNTRINDIALLRLDRTLLEFTDYIRPICVFPPGPMSANIGNTLYITGWGRKSRDEDATEIKKKIATTLITKDQCAKEFAGKNIADSQICTRDFANNTEFTCQGDAGAPVMFVFGRLRQWHLEGVSSWGGVCGSDGPRVHTRVTHYLDWIQENIRP